MFKKLVILSVASLIASTPLIGDQDRNYSLAEQTIRKKGEHIMRRTRDGTLIELEEGSSFEIDDTDADEVREWDYGTFVKLSPAPSCRCSGSGDYYITNCNTDDRVRGSYHQEPDLKNPLALKIFHIDPYEGIIYLVDGYGNQTRWKIYEKDREYVHDWKKGETAIIGFNNAWFQDWRSLPKYILISYVNTNKVKYIRVSED